MEKRDRNYVVAGNNKTFLSLGGYTNQEENDHEEADTLIIRCLRLVDDFIENKIVNVYSPDTSERKSRYQTCVPKAWKQNSQSVAVLTSSGRM